MSYAAPTYAALAGRPLAARPAALAAPATTRGLRTDASVARYREAELAASSPGQLVVLLFDKCLVRIRRAQAAFAAGDIAARAEHVCAAMEMVGGLRGALDFEAGGDLSPQLDALYAYVLRELFAANREQAPAKLDPVLHVLSELRAGFAGAVAQLAAGETAGPAARPA